MSVSTNNILMLLSDLSVSADKVIEENKLPLLSDWVSLLHKKADSIVEGESTSGTNEMPSLMAYLRSPKKSVKRGLRVSSVLTQIQKMHLHRKGNSKSFAIQEREKESSHTQITRKSLQSPVRNVLPKVEIAQNVNSSISPPQVTHIHRILKRKSSSELPLFLENLKKPKFDQLNSQEIVQNSKIEKKQNSSLLKANMSVLKENHSSLTLQSKIQTKQDKAVENRKNIMALRQQKLEENKKTRQEKMEISLKQHAPLKLGKKIYKFKKRSGGHEKNQTTPQEKVSDEIQPSSKNNIMKTSLSVKKKPQAHKKLGTRKVVESERDGPSTGKVKREKHETKEVLNTTYVAPGEKSSNKVINSKEKNVRAAISKPQTTHAKDKTFVKLVNSTTTLTPGKKGPESYAITPARSSFVSYDISEIRSDSEEEQDTNSKPIPSWATGVRLRNTLLQQHHHPIDADKLFGNVLNLPDLAVIMGNTKKNYRKRTSSAVWSNFS